jgi:hypothetical protein
MALVRLWERRNRKQRQKKPGRGDPVKERVKRISRGLSIISVKSAVTAVTGGKKNQFELKML